MKNVDLNGIIIMTLLMGGMFTFLGWVIKSQNAGDMINIFDEKKHDKNKVSKIMGKNLLAIGLIIFALGGIGLSLGDKSYNYISFGQAVVVILGIAKGVYEMNKYGKTNR